MTRILITIDWFLPGTNSGGPVRSVANLIAAMPECQFYVFTRNQDYCATDVYEGITPNTWMKFSENCEVYYCAESELEPKVLEKEIRQIAPDVLYVNGIYSKAFSRWPLTLGKKLGIHTIVAVRGMLSPHALAVKALKKYLFLTYMRWLNSYSQVTFHATSEVEKADIQHVLGRQVKVSVIPNLARLNQIESQPIQKEEGTLKLVSIGRIAPEKGTIHGLNALKTQNGTIQLELFGTCYNESYWQQCRDTIAQLPTNINVNYHGPCPSDDVALHLASTHALLLPSEGENYGHAIVESFGQGRPVLISKHTPWQELASQKAGWDVAYESLAQAISELSAMDQQTYNTWSEGAFHYYQKMIVLPFEENRKAYLRMLGYSD